MAKIVLILLAAFLACVSADVWKQGCQYIVNTTVYNLLPLSSNPIATVHDAGHNVIDKNYDIMFHLCDRQINSCGSNLTKVYANATDLTDNSCLTLTNAESPNATFVNSSNATEGVVLHFQPFVINTSSADPASINSPITHNLVVRLLCDRNISASDIQWQASHEGPEYNRTWIITGSGDPGCPKLDLKELLDFFYSHRYIFGAIFFAIGIFSLLAGVKFFNVTIFVFTTTLVSVALSVLIIEVSKSSISTTTEWVIFALCFIVGLGVGYAAVKIERLGFFALGALFGGLAALFLYTLVLHFFALSQIILYVVIALFAIIGGGLALWLWKDIIILATSCIGAYMTVRGASFIIGGFPNELEVAEGTATYETTKDYVYAYGYLAAIILIAIGGIIYQYKKQKKEEENEEEYHRESLVRQEYY